MKVAYIMLASIALTSCASVTTEDDPFLLGCHSITEDAKTYFELPSSLTNIGDYYRGAITCDQLSTVKYMVDSGIANVNGEDNIALTYAISRNNTEVANYILNHPDFDGSIDSQLDRALKVAYRNDIEMVQTLVEHGANVNYKNNDESVFSRFVLHGEVEAVKYLVEQGAIVENEDKNLVAQALTQREEKTAIYLIEIGFPVVGVKNQGWTPYKLAVKNNMSDVVDVILDKLPNDRIKLSMINEALMGKYLNKKMSATLQTQKEIILAKL